MESSREPTRETQDSVSFRFIFKWLIAAVIICGGVGGGIYTGFALSDRGYGLPSEEALKNTTYLEIGQVFPDYEVKDHASGATLTISELAQDDPVLLVFVSSTCGACKMMDGFWERRVINHLDKDIRIVCVYDSWEERNEGFDTTALPGSQVVTTDRTTQMLTDGINGTPTFIGLTKENKIALIVSGFDKNIGADYFNDKL